MSKHGNIAVFVPHVGCPCLCSFCDQRVISGENVVPTGETVKTACQEGIKQNNQRTLELAFFGGSFTAIDLGLQVELLEAVQEFLGKGIDGIRISTRPDCINDEILLRLKKYGVTAIELGAQSLDDEVLDSNNRGHNAQQIVEASKLIKDYGFQLGLQMMTGLYGSTAEKDLETAEKIINLKPANVRIYPTITLKGTELHNLYNSCDYKPQQLAEAVTATSEIMEMFIKSNIKIIRVGLHPSKELEEKLVAGAYHPAFRELCEGEIMLRKLLEILPEDKTPIYKVGVNPKDVSKMAGQNRCNIKALNQMGYKIKIREDSEIKSLTTTIV